MDGKGIMEYLTRQNYELAPNWANGTIPSLFMAKFFKGFTEFYVKQGKPETGELSDYVLAGRVEKLRKSNLVRIHSGKNWTIDFSDLVAKL
jgi:retron-type reverse transcriptase